MEIPLLYNKVHDSENAQFIADVTNLVEFIFATDNAEDDKYMMSDGSNIDDAHFNIRSKDEDSFTSDDATQDKPHIDLKGLGPIERDLMLRIKNAKYSTLVFSGGLGSGKSTVARYVLGQISRAKRLNCDACSSSAECSSQNEIMIAIDFNKNFDSASDYDSIMRNFKQELNHKLKQALRRIFSVTVNIDDFIEALRTYSGKYDENWQETFTSFLVENVDKKGRRWISKTPKTKLDELFTWIEKKRTDDEELLVLLTKVYKFVRERYPKQLKGCLVALFDNIDHLAPDCQRAIVTYLDRFTAEAQIRTLIPVRLTTFSRVKEALGARPYGRYQNAPPRPTKIIHSRIEQMLNEPAHAQWNDLRGLSESIVKERLRAFNALLNPQTRHNRLAECIDALSGSSVRRGLFLSERAIKNYAFKYGDREAWKSQDAYIKALLVGTNLTGKMSVSDHYVANIFCNGHEGHPSLICIRILQLLTSTWRHQIRYQVKHLMVDLNRFFPYSNDAVVQAIRYLMSIKRRMVFLASTPALEEISNDDLLRSEIEIEITLAGRKYVEHLIGDLTYGQECFLSIDWDMNELAKSVKQIKNNVRIFVLDKLLKGRNTRVMEQQFSEFFDNSSHEHDELNRLFPPVVNTTFERLQIVRKSISIFARMEMLQLLSYRYATKEEPKRKTSIQGSALSSAIGRMALSVLNIHRNSSELRKDDELRDWYNLCLMLFNIEALIFPSRVMGDLDHAVDSYAEFLEIRDRT